MNIKGRLKVGKYFQTAFGLIGKNIFKKDRVRAYRTHPTDGFCGIAGRVSRTRLQATACWKT